MNPTETRLAEQLATLKLAAVHEHHAALATEAAQKQWTHVDYLARFIDSETFSRCFSRWVVNGLVWVCLFDPYC